MNSIRKIAALFLVFVAGAAGATDINVTDAQVAPGGTATVTISLANLGAPSIVSARLNYAASEFFAVGSTPLTGGASCDVSTPGQVNFLAMPPTAGAQCEITFSASPTATTIGMPSERARIDPCDTGLPCVVTTATTRVGSRWAACTGLRSVATSTPSGPSVGLPPSALNAASTC